MEVLDAVEDGGEIVRGVVGGPVGFPDDERLLLEARVLRMEDHQRPFALHRQAAAGELAVDRREPVIVEALAEGDVEVDAELVVDLLKGVEAGLVDLLPDGAIRGIAALEFDQLALCLPEYRRVGLGRGGADPVEAFELLERVAGERRRIEVALVGPDEFAELRCNTEVLVIKIVDDIPAATGATSGFP